MGRKIGVPRKSKIERAVTLNTPGHLIRGRCETREVVLYGIDRYVWGPYSTKLLRVCYVLANLNGIIYIYIYIGTK